DRAAVPARDHIEAPPDRRRAGVAGAALAPLDAIAEPLQRRDPLMKRLPLARLAWDHHRVAVQIEHRAAGGVALLHQRPPIAEFLDVFEHDHARPIAARELRHDPRQIPDLALDRPAPLRLAEMLTVRRCPERADAAVADQPIEHAPGGPDVL